MGLFTEHPHTAISSTISQIVSSRDHPLEDELDHLVSLIEMGNDYEKSVHQQEAARAIRKKLKYGNKILDH